jgi:bifunctional non-homologous end joining protein LigD
MSSSRLRSRPIPIGFIHPCLPVSSRLSPAGKGWIHEIKHDGYRLLALRSGGRVRLFTRNGFDWTERFPRIVAAVSALNIKSCIIDGEAICIGRGGLADFALLCSGLEPVILCAFDLLTIDGDDLRLEPIEERKRLLAGILKEAKSGLVLNQYIDGEDAADVFKHACGFGTEGIVSKRRGSPYQSGRCYDWIKRKNPLSPAVRREAEEDWTR